MATEDDSHHSNDDYVNALIGMPPANWRQKIEAAMKLCELAEAQKLFDPFETSSPEDVPFIAAMAVYQHVQSNKPEEERNNAGYTVRARQVAKWLDADFQKRLAEMDMSPDSLPVLENKAQEVGRQISRMLYKTDGFLLALFHRGNEHSPGYTTYVSDTSRAVGIKVLSELQHKLADDHLRDRMNLKPAAGKDRLSGSTEVEREALLKDLMDALAEYLNLPSKDDLAPELERVAETFTKLLAARKGQGL